MDLSGSMRSKKDELAKLGVKLAEAMRKVTSNFQMGFGGFIDKVAMPFTLTTKEWLRNPCGKSKCDPPYSFRNLMPLDKNANLFSRKVADALMSTNLDAPEGGLDALMQAIVCTERIRWRKDARHLLVFTTDNLYHIAGDGKLAGAVEPNSENCHLNDQNEYIAYADYDYPTISQINRKAKEKKINIIFAVTKNVRDVYADLSKSIQGSEVEVLPDKSKFKNNFRNKKDEPDKLVHVITDAYSKFDKSVEIVDDAGGTGIGVIYKTNCADENKITNRCSNVSAGVPISFEVNITVQSCPSRIKDEIWKKTIHFNPQGLDEKFKLDLEVFCSCPCEIEGHELFQYNASECNRMGTRKCGVCQCHSGWIGQSCECDLKTTALSRSDDVSLCVTNNFTQEVCNGRGFCLCGKCACHKRNNPEEIIYGKHCECDNFSCERREGKMCSGPEKGQCNCGKCICKAGWTGKACECPEILSACIAPGEDVECSGYGKCECGRCKCTAERSGKYCGDCLSCPGSRCKEFADCVECMAYNTGRHAATACANCSIPKPSISTVVEEDLLEEERLCKLPDEAGCSFVFSYLEKPELSFRAEKEKECSASIPLIAIIVGVTGSTLLLGILIIVIWKVITTIHDRKEYERYVRELENTKWAEGDNPLHQVPTTTTMNPTYHSRKSRFSFRMQ